MLISSLLLALPLVGLSACLMIASNVYFKRKRFDLIATFSTLAFGSTFAVLVASAFFFVSLYISGALLVATVVAVVMTKISSGFTDTKGSKKTYVFLAGIFYLSVTVSVVLIIP